MIVKTFVGLLFLIATQTFAIAGEFTTALGGASPVAVSAIATDAHGNTYIVGSTQLPGSPTFVNSAISAQAHVFVTKLNAAGTVLFTDVLAGQGLDTPNAVAVDPAGNIYVAGITTSADFPLSHALQSQIFPIATVNGVPTGSGFITKLTSDGTAILYSTFFGGTLGQSSISSLAVDAAGNLYLTGYTQASDFPHTAGMPFGALSQSPASPGAIVASISATGDKILYSGAIVMPTPCSTDSPACISHTLQWEGVGIAVDAAGNAYVAGNDPSATNLPTTDGALLRNGIGAFVAKVNAGGSGLGYLTYLTAGKVGSAPFFSSETTLNAIAVDAAGNAYLAGQTADPNFPVTPGSFQPTPAQTSTRGFLAKLNPQGSALPWATYFDAPQSVAVDTSGNVWVVGQPASALTPNTNGWTTGQEFVAELNAAGSKLLYSALYPSGTVAQAIAIDPAGSVHVAGLNGFVSTIAPAAPPTPRVSYLGNAAGSAATARISPAEVIAIYGPGVGPATPVTAVPVNGFYPTTLGGVEVSINGLKLPLLYVSQSQINAVVPMGLAADSAANLHIARGTLAIADYPVWIVAGTSQVFAPVTNADGTLNSQTNPAKAGSVVSFYVTGWQPNFAPLADGQVSTDPRDTCLGRCSATGQTLPLPFVNQLSLSASVLYAGAAPGVVAGITQIKVQLGPFPSSVGSAAASFILSFIPSSGIGFATSLWITP